MFGKITSFFGAFSLQTKLIAVGAIVIISFSMGVKVANWRNDSLKLQATSVAKKIVKAALPKVEQNINTFEAKQVKERIVYRTIREKIDEQTTGNICFDTNSLSLWNDAIAGTHNNKPEPTTGPGTTDTAKSDEEVTDTDVLKNAADNYEICNRNSGRQKALIDELNIYKGHMCVCTD